MFLLSCTFIGLFLFLLGTSGNTLCTIVFLRQKFRHRLITPYFVVLLCADSIYLFFRLIKLFYYSHTLFDQKLHWKESCSNASFVRTYQYATQTWPQISIPFIHSETYIRFSIILMCIISVQRTIFIARSLNKLVLPAMYNDSSKHKWTFIFILIAFCLAYAFEFFGLTIFCSKSNNREISYEWFTYMAKHMDNSSHLLLNTIHHQPNAYQCVNEHFNDLKFGNQTLFNVCTKEELMDILSYYFDQHQRSIVTLIHKIFYHQTGHRLSRNEIRRKFHFHECVFPQDPQVFHRFYSFIYGRTLRFNRYTLILVFGSILPSFITIISNGLTVCRIRQLNRLTSNYIVPCRRRINDTHRVLVVITVECLFAIVNSWFSNILIAFIYCKGTLLADDDCPKYLKSNYGLLVMFDMFNSISNIILHCLCEKHFRHELCRIFQRWYEFFREIFTAICCYCYKKHCRQNNEQSRVYYEVSVTNRANSNSSSNESRGQVYLTIHRSSRIARSLVRNYQSSSNGRLFDAFQRSFSSWKRTLLRNDRVSIFIRYHLLTKRSNNPTSPNSTIVPQTVQTEQAE